MNKIRSQIKVRTNMTKNMMNPMKWRKLTPLSREKHKNHPFCTQYAFLRWINKWLCRCLIKSCYHITTQVITTIDSSRISTCRWIQCLQIAVVMWLISSRCQLLEIKLKVLITIRDCSHQWEHSDKISNWKSFLI